MALVTLMAVALGGVLAPLASAHGDAATLDEPFELAPGESLTFTREVHWHRILGSLEANSDVTLSVDGVVIAGPGRNMVVDHLVACCEATWTELAFAIRNVGTDVAQVDARLSFLHDNLAVLVDDAEPGGWWQTLLIVGVVVGVPAWRARVPLRGASGAALASPVLWLRRSRMFHAATWLAALALAAVGMARFGSGPLVGSLGATAPFPSGFGGFFNTHSFVMLGLMALWGAAYAYWAGARRRGAAGNLDAWLFAVGALAVGAAMFAELGGGWIPVMLGAIPAAAILADHYVAPPDN